MAEPLNTSGFVGRHEELAVIGHALGEAGEGAPSVLLVGGDAGIGKSTLVRQAAGQFVTGLYLGRCVHLGGDVIALAPLVDLLRQIQRGSPDIWADTTEFASLSQWLTPVAGSPVGAPELGGVFGPVLELIARLAQDRTVMVGFEDLHWADSMTWNLVEFLARNLLDEHVVLVGTYRADEVWGDPQLAGRLAELTRLPGARRIHLEGLGREDVDAAVSAMLGRPAGPALVDDVVGRGQGNPFFTEALVAAHAAGESIPAVLSDLLSADIVELDDRSRQVLGVIATIGRDVDHDLLLRIIDLDDDALEKAIRAAMDARVLLADDGTGAYRFRHALIGEVVYRDLLVPQRQRIHRRIADAIDDGSAPLRADAAAELAFHLDRAGDAAAAFTALLVAADTAEAVAPRAALGFLERAFELWDTAGAAAGGVARSDRLWQAAELASGTVGNERSVEFATQALTLGTPPLGEAWGHERLGRYLWTSGHLAESAIQFETAARLVVQDDGGVVVAATLGGLGQAELMACRFESAERLCRRLFELVPEPDIDPAAWVMGRRVLGVTRGALGHPDEAVRLCREAVDAAPSAQTRALACLYLASVLLDGGDCQEAVDVARASAADVDRAGIDRSTAGYLDAVAAEGLMRLGRWPEAAALLALHSEPDNLPVGEIRLGRTRAMLAARQGESDRAKAHLLDATSQPIDPWHQPLLDAAAADVHLTLGEWTQAAAHAEHGWTSSGTGSAIWPPRFAMFSVASATEQVLDAQARQETVDVPGTVQRLRERIDTAREGAGGPPSTADGAAHLAHAEASLTRLTGADPDAWALTAEAFEQIADEWYVATARLREAEAAVATAETARAATALQEAQRRASVLGAVPLLAAIAAVARRTRLSLEAPPSVVMDKHSTAELGLTAREGEVLALIAIGNTNREIGETLYISEKTASVHVSNILRKLSVSSRVDAAAIAQRLAGDG